MESSTFCSYTVLWNLFSKKSYEQFFVNFFFVYFKKHGEFLRNVVISDKNFEKKKILLSDLQSHKKLLSSKIFPSNQAKFPQQINSVFFAWWLLDESLCQFLGRFFATKFFEVWFFFLTLGRDFLKKYCVWYRSC